MTIVITDEWLKGPAARAIPGSYWSEEHDAWVLDEPTPRGAAVALQLFPHLIHDAPELAELRDALMRDAKPIDYATPYGKRIGAPRVRAEMAARGWSLDVSKVKPVNGDVDYQALDLGYVADVLRQHGGAYIGWDRGLGKTLATAALIDDLDAKSTLIIAPNTAKQSTWADELAWACPWLTVLVLPNDAVRRSRVLLEARALATNGTPFVLIAHYEALAIIAGKTTHAKGRKLKTTRLNDGWKKLGVNWTLKVADEGHRFANPDSQLSRAAGRIPADMRLILSGSVFQNRWEEMYGPLHFLFPKRYSSRGRDWGNRFLDYVDNGFGRTCVGVLPDRVEAMRDELGRFMVYREKASLAQAETIKVPLSPTQQKVYTDLAETCLAELEDGTRIKAVTGIGMLTKLRVVASGLDLVSHQVEDSSKLDAVVARVQECSPRGDDFVIFVWYKSSARALHERLAAIGVDSWVITGDVKQTDRTEIIRAFTAGEKRVLIGTIPTMGESVNLQRANHVIRLDRSFNPALNQQAVDRCDRQGQTREVYLTDVVAADTVDELVVMPNLANKQAMRAVVFGGQG